MTKISIDKKADERFFFITKMNCKTSTAQKGFDNLHTCAANQSDRHSSTLYGAENQYQRLDEMPLEEDPRIFELLSLMGKHLQGANASGAHALKPKVSSSIDMPPPVRYIRAKKNSN